MDINNQIPLQNATPLPAKLTSSGNGKGIGLILVLFTLVVILASVAGYLIYYKNQMTEKSAANEKTENTVIPTPALTVIIQPTLTPTPAADDASYLQSIDLGSPEAEINDIKNDISGL